MNTLCAALRGTALSSRLLRLATSLVAGLALAAGSLYAQATGSVAGSVTSTATRNALQGATVTIPKLGRTVFTDEAGRFLLPDVPAGVTEVIVSYSGFGDFRQQVSVGSGAQAQVDVQMKSSEVTMMEKFTVDSVKEGQALALTQQRNAANIKNVTAMDEWGVLPTQNAAELLTRLPGLSVAQFDEDGLMMSVSIGGQPGGNAGYTRMNIDGMASTGVGGDGRTATMHVFSAAMYEQVEVIAGQTPDKRADGLGGQLNFVTASPLAIAGRRRVDFTAAGRWFPSWSKRNDIVSDHAFRPDFNFTYRGVYDVKGGTRNLGLMIGATYQEVVNPHDFNILLYQNTANPVAWLQDYQRSSGLNDRFISGVNLRADYRMSQSTRLSVRFLYNASSEPFFQYTHVNPFASANLTQFDPNVATSTGSIMPGFTETRTEIRPTTTTSGVAGVSVGAARMRLNMWKVSFTSKNPTGTVALDHNWGRLKVDHSYRWSHTHWDSNAGRNREGGELQMRTRDPIGFTLDRSNLEGRVFTQNTGPSVYDTASYTPFVVTARNATTQPVDQTSAVFIKRDNVTDTNEVSAMINASYLLPTEMPITLKTGLDTVNRRVNAYVPSARRWYGVTGSVIPANSGLVPLTEFEVQHPGQRLPVFDPAAVSTTLGNTGLWTEDVNFNAVEKYRSTRIVEEGVDSGYIQGSTKIGRFTALGGVRTEWVSTEAFFYVAAAAARRTSIAAEPDPIKRAIRDFTPSSVDGKYHKYFPSIHLAYDVTSSLKLRTSWSKSYGRPRLQDLVAIPTAAESTTNPPGTITTGNTDLRPAVAKNIDFRIDYTYSSTGFLSARFFKKNINDYIGSARNSGVRVPDGPDNGFSGQYVGYELIEPVNLGTTESKGMELDFRQRLTFLPGALKGLSLRANYTNVRTWAVFNGISYKPGQVVGSAGQWYIPRTYNVGLQYFYGKFGANFDVNYTSQFPIIFGLTTFGTNAYRKHRILMNTGFSYQLRPEATLFLNVNNLSEEGLNSYTSLPTRTRQVNILPMSLKFGVSGRF